MRHSLLLHPTSLNRAVASIEAYVSRDTDRLVDFRFLLYCELGDVRLPSTRRPRRRDGLWKTTCFELFLTLPTGYCEFNFSPSREWAAYRFTDYRAGMSSLEGISPPKIRQDGGQGFYDIEGQFELPDLTHNAQPEMGISAVIQETNGAKSYWALAHAPGPPDFHNPACFTATLPPPPRA